MVLCLSMAHSQMTKIYLHYSRNNIQSGMLTLPENLDKLVSIANSWNLSLSDSKCVIIRFSHFSDFEILDDGFQYRIRDSILEVVKCHRDLRVEVDRDLKYHCHVTKLVCRAAGLLNSLLHATVNRSPKFMTPLFVTHIRPILDYCSTVWNVGYDGDVTLLEGVQRRWTKNID